MENLTGNLIQHIDNIKTLQKLADKGLIKLAPETGCIIGGKMITYIGGCDSFKLDGYKYFEKYTSGCFYPKLFRVKI